MPAELLDQRGRRPYKTAGMVLIAVAAVALGLLFGQFRGGYSDETDLTMLSERAGLVLEPGSKVTFNGVEIGKVERTDVVDVGGVPKAKITVAVESKYLQRIPANVAPPRSVPPPYSATSTWPYPRPKIGRPNASPAPT